MYEFNEENGKNEIRVENAFKKYKKNAVLNGLYMCVNPGSM